MFKRRRERRVPLSRGATAGRRLAYYPFMIKLYHCAGARSARTLWLLEELQLQYQLTTLPFNPKAMRANEDFVRVAPLARVPALQDGEVRLFESGAICEYLCETYDREARLWRAPGHPERAEWLQWLHYAESVAVHAAALIQQHVIIPEPQRSPTVQKLETRRLQKTLEVLQQHLHGREYLLTSGFSAADCGVGVSLALARNFTNLGAPEFARVDAYFTRLAARAAFRKALPAQG